MSEATQTLTDALGREIILPEAPQRIVSLCPSQTETLFALGLGGRIVGRTRFCIHPEPEIAEVERVGGTKEIDFERLKTLNPDLILCEKEENTPEMVAELEKHYPVLVTDVTDVASAMEMILFLGEATGKQAEAREIHDQIQQNWEAMPMVTGNKTIAYFIWRKPWMVVGANTYINSVLEKLQLNNLAAKMQGRYPELSPNLAELTNPEWIFLSSEPYPFAEKHIAEIQEYFPDAKIQLVDGEMFSWYGSRMLKVPEYLAKLCRIME